MKKLIIKYVSSDEESLCFIENNHYIPCKEALTQLGLKHSVPSSFSVQNAKESHHPIFEKALYDFLKDFSLSQKYNFIQELSKCDTDYFNHSFLRYEMNKPSLSEHFWIVDEKTRVVPISDTFKFHNIGNGKEYYPLFNTIDFSLKYAVNESHTFPIFSKLSHLGFWDKENITFSYPYDYSLKVHKPISLISNEKYKAPIAWVVEHQDYIKIHNKVYPVKEELIECGFKIILNTFKTYTKYFIELDDVLYSTHEEAKNQIEDQSSINSVLENSIHFNIKTQYYTEVKDSVFEHLTDY